MIKMYNSRQAVPSLILFVETADHDHPKQHGCPRGQGKGHHGHGEGKGRHGHGGHGPHWLKQFRNSFFRAPEVASTKQQQQQSEEALIEAAILETVQRLSESTQGVVEEAAAFFFAPASDEDRHVADASGTEDALLEAALLESMAAAAVTAFSGSEGGEAVAESKDQQEEPEQAPAITAAVEVLVAELTVPVSVPVMQLVADATFPDGTRVEQSVLFQKTWLVRNSGSCAWPDRCQLLPDGGDDLLPNQYQAGPSAAVPAVAAGREAELRVRLSAPHDSTGRHVSFFRLATADGDRFGDRLSVDIVVTQAAAAAAELAAVVEEQQQQQQAVEEELDPWTLVADIQAELLQTPVPVPVLAVLTDGEVLQRQIWAAELAVLANMGFLDAEPLLPLLRHHVRVSAATKGKAFADPIALESVINALFMI